MRLRRSWSRRAAWLAPGAVVAAGAGCEHAAPGGRQVEVRLGDSLAPVASVDVL